MAYVNVRDWSVDQVTDWLKGLDSIILQYTTSFLNNGVTGHQLLSLRAEDLYNLGVKSLGHQEVILESVEHLRHFHFELDKENLQMLALRVSCASNSLFKELLLVDDDCPLVSTHTMADVHNIITTIKPLVCWLDRAPFLGDKDYIDCKSQLLELGFEMATMAHRGKFSMKPVSGIKKICEKITKLADHIIQEISDPMILQPASLDLATLKKKEQEFGFFISPNNHAIHQIAEIKYGSPAHGSTKIEEGDEIVQVNYQTVVGWQRKNVMILLQDSPPEIVLTLKKRPRHTKVYGQIYMKPYRLPSKKLDGQPYFRWNDSIPPPRLLPIHNLSPINIPKLPPVIEPPDVETELSSSDDSEPPDSPLDGSGRMYPLKPRPILQRRNTITGATPTSKRPYPSLEQYWQIWKDHAVSTHSSSYNIDKTNFESDSNFHRDKSASCNLGLDLGPRPTTVIGIPPNRNRTSFRNELKEKSPKKKVNFQEKKNDPVEKKDVCSSNLSEEKSVSVVSLASLTNENIAFIDEGRELTDRTSMVTESDDVKRDCDHLQITHEKVKDAVLAEVKIHDIIKKFDEHKQETVVKPKIYPRSQIKKPPDVPQKPDSSKKPVVPPRSVTTKIRGRLDKSHSTPAYDLTGDENVPVEKFVVEKTQAEIIVENHNSVSESKVDVEPFTETKFELGIPVVEAINFPLTQNLPAVEEIKCTVTQVVEKTVEIKEEIIDEDLPPKPPPRTFGVVDLNKPAYPIDSPKPNISEKLKTDQSLPPKTTVFEFPETKPISLYSVESTIMVSTTTKPPESPALLKDNGKVQSKHFEPKVASTPKTKTELENEGMGYKSTPSFDSQKNMSDNKISPTNSIVRAMIYSNKNKAGKKKNTITAKRRRVTVNDLNPPDTQGFLYQRLRSKHNQNIHWEKRWFVLLGSCLYGFKTKEDPRAACLIFLSGFTVAVASEVKSRSNAFKVYHTGTVFYFSAEDPEALQSWIEMITAATLNNECLKITDGSLYSETDESDNDKPKKIEPEKNPESIKKFGSLKKLTSKKHEGTSSGSTSLDRKRFFNKSSSHSKNSLPVPTAQFRSYRKIKTNEGHTTGNSTWHVASFLQTTEIPKLQQSGQNVSVPNLTVEHLGKGQDGAKAPTGKLSKVKPINYVHASNPSLCNINDFNVPSFTKKSFKQCNENLAGFVTLEELMIRQSEERKMNPYNTDEDVFINLNLIKPDVVYGEVPIRPKEKVEVEEKGEPTFKRGHSRNASDSQKSSEKQDFSSSCFGKRLGSLKKSHKEDDAFENRTSTYPKIAKGFDQKLNRSLPRTHKVSDNPDGSNRYASDRNLAGAERGYEMIYCPETTTDIQFAQNRNLDDRMYKDTPKKSHKIKKQHSFTSADKKSVKSIVETVKYTNKVSDSSTGKLKSVDQYTRMCLPLAQDQKNKPKLAFELNLDEKGTKGGKLKQIFGKQGEGKKEKTFLGSPKLHRTIFRKSNTGSEINWPSSSSQSVPISQSTYSLENTPPAEPLSMSISPHADYPGLEYPPVFEPETYSLADPQSSLTLLRKQGELFKRYRERSLLYFPIFKERVLGFKIVHLIHPEDIKIVLTGKSAHKETRFFVNWLGRSVLNDKGGHRWHYKRKLITPFFNVKVLQDYVTTLREKAKDLVLAVEECEGTVVEVVPYVSNYVSNCVIALTMGKDAFFDVQLFNESTNEVKNCVTKRLCTPWMYNDFLYNLSHYGKTEATLVDTIHKITNSVIKCKMKDWKNGVKEGNFNLLEFLLKAKHNGADLDESGIREELVSILMAGHDTTASNLSFVLMLLANHKEVQDRVFEELCSVLGDVEKEPTYEDLQDLKYMHQCIKESLRLYPSVPNLARRSSKIMTTHTGYVIPEDTLLSLGIFDMHHNPNVYPDPEKFDPDRFAPENAKKIHPFAFLPFSGGSRNCIGQKFAILQMKMSLCALLKKFVLKPVDTPSSVRLISSITLNVENGIRVRFLPRIHKELIR